MCIANPFDINCDSDVYFKDYAVQARAARVAFCNIPANNNDSYCLGAGTMVTTVQICNFDPFSRYCFSGTTYKTARENRIVSCSRLKSFGKGDCAGVRDRATTAGWLNSFPSSPDSSPSTSRPKNQFLQTNVSGLNVGTTTTADGSGSPTVFYLNMSVLGGDVKDGLGFFTGYINGTRYNYVGILEQADLGAPLTQTSGTAYWNGQIESFTDGFNVRDFVLTVNFGGDRGAGNIDAFVKANNDIRSDLYYVLDGEFDRDGIIDGTTRMGRYAYGNRGDLIVNSWTDGRLSGLIGTEGAVAGFISKDGASVGYAGGFIASPAARTSPRATYSNWTRSFSTLPPFSPQNVHNASNRVSFSRNQFLRTSSSGKLNTGATIVSSTDRSRPTPTYLNLANGTFDDIALGGDRTDGVAFFHGKQRSSSVSSPIRYFHYAAIDSRTNLGAPLTQTSGTARWNGQLSTFINNDAIRNTNFTLEINFGNNRLEAFVPIGTRTAAHYFKGSYDANGVMDGTVDFGGFRNNNRHQPTANRAPNGFFSGLIGKEGAVGAFISGSGNKNAITPNTISSNYSGGFVACPASGC